MSELKVDRSLVQQLAALARLAVAPDQEAVVAERLGRVLAAFAALRQVDTEGVEPETYPLPLPLRLRADVPVAPMAPEQALANASKTAAGAFLVPRVVDA